MTLSTSPVTTSAQRCTTSSSRDSHRSQSTLRYFWMVKKKMEGAKRIYSPISFKISELVKNRRAVISGMSWSSLCLQYCVLLQLLSNQIQEYSLHLLRSRTSSSADNLAISLALKIASLEPMLKRTPALTLSTIPQAASIWQRRVVLPRVI